MFQPIWFLRVIWAVVLPALIGYAVLWHTMLKHTLQDLGLVKPDETENQDRDGERAKLTKGHGEDRAEGETKSGDTDGEDRAETEDRQ